jgi:hypothetical protein
MLDSQTEIYSISPMGAIAFFDGYIVRVERAADNG